MRWIIVCVILFLAVPAWAAKKKNKAAQPPPQTQQIQEEEPIESNLWNQKLCPNGIEDLEVLLKINPYDSEGRCFNYIGRLVQLLNKNQAFFSFMTASTPFSLVDFGKYSVPMGPFYAVVKGKGAYSYETVSGSQNIIFSFVNVPKSKGREAWEKKKTIEKKQGEERQLTEKRATAEQAWKQEIQDSGNSQLIAEPLIFADTSTGLMWTRNGNISEKTMEVKDATEWLKKLNYAGYSDWRLPTKEELYTFIKNNKLVSRDRTQNDGFFNVQGTYVTSTKYQNYRDIYWSYRISAWGEWTGEGPITRNSVWPVREDKGKNEQN